MDLGLYGFAYVNLGLIENYKPGVFGVGKSTLCKTFFDFVLIMKNLKS